jgi:hypothetical protein
MSLLESALALDTGSVCDEGSEDFNTSVDIILYIIRLAARVHNYVCFVVAHTKGSEDSIDINMREEPPEADSLRVLETAMLELGAKLRGSVNALLDDYLRRCDAQTRASPDNETLINRNSRLACDLHAHKLLIHRNCFEAAGAPLDCHIATTILGSFVYLTTRHTWNKPSRGHGRLVFCVCTCMYA